MAVFSLTMLYVGYGTPVLPDVRVLYAVSLLGFVNLASRDIVWG